MSVYLSFGFVCQAVDHQAQLKRAKQQRVLELLRASHPCPPMVTRLDVQSSNLAEEHPDIRHNVPAAAANDLAAPGAKTRSSRATCLSRGMKNHRITQQTVKSFE